MSKKNNSVNLSSEYKKAAKSSEWTFQKETWGEKEQSNKKKQKKKKKKSEIVWTNLLGKAENLVKVAYAVPRWRMQ